MSVEAVIDADSARVNAASLHLAAALAQAQTGSEANPSEIQRGHAAVQAAEAVLAQAEATLHADQSASPATAASVAPNAAHSVTDPGGIVV